MKKYLLDTHLLLWASLNSNKLSQVARVIMNNKDNELIFSAASIWEIAIKSQLGRPDFQVNASVFRTGLVSNGYVEMDITGVHGVEAGKLPSIHSDPFDRMLVAQANTEGVILLTADQQVSSYVGNIILV
jgi:PIN domain nuclease of toxin-antitoxin system